MGQSTLGNNLIKNLRVYVKDSPGYLGKLMSTFGEMGANVGDLRLVKRAPRYNYREVELYVNSEEHMNDILARVGELEGIQIDSVQDAVLELHRGGKIEMHSRIEITEPSLLRRIYTPGVAEVCRAIQKNPESFWDYTYVSRSVAIVTNGTAILGLGNIGVHAGMPVMEGKSVIFQHLVGISGVPILVDTTDIDTFVSTVQHIAHSFGAIKIEDVSAPDCFEVETRINESVDLPVMHDDQHGTAIVALAALINATRYTGEQLKRQVVGVLGLGAAGTGIAKLLQSYGVHQLIGVDPHPSAQERLKELGGEPDTLEGMMSRAGVIVATTGVTDLISPELVEPRQIILALSNPYPEITPEDAMQAGAAFAADGRGVNNALAFPGMFNGALRARARKITGRMKIAAARTIASFANVDRQELVPRLLNVSVHEAVTLAVERAAFESGAVRVQEEE